MLQLQSQRYKALAKRKHSCSNLHESAGLGEEVVDGVAGHPPDDDDDDDDKIPPWWGNVSNDKGGNVSVSNSHHT